MLIPLPYIILIPYRLIRFVIYWILRKRRLSEEDKQVLKWLKKPDDPLRAKDTRVKYFAESKAAIEANEVVHLRYRGRKDVTCRKFIPERLFRRGEHLYLEAFCLRERE